MRRIVLATLLIGTGMLAAAQTDRPSAAPETSLAPLSFLLGTWAAHTNAPEGSAGANADGAYTFSLDLAGHAIDRTSSLDTCTGPRAFDCTHHDRLTIFFDPQAARMHGSSLLAFYQDSEGHVIYYTLTLPDAHTAIFNSQGPAAAPKFRLVYHLEGSGPKAVMSGKFQSAAPGTDEFHSYLEWSGTKQ